jgi:uncharacterized protein YjiS (DUF1127 family)
MLLSKLVNPIYLRLYSVLAHYRASVNKKRSERALAKLDAHLLDDIGLRRIDEVIVPKSTLVDYAVVEKSARKSRVRHPYLIRRRQE